MKTLLWAEWKKIRRSKITRIAVFALVMTAAIVFTEGQDIYYGPDLNYGVKTLQGETRYIDNAGWFMDETQPLATIFVLPAVIALFGSYIICREEEDNTINALRLIPVNEAELTFAKMTVAFAFSISLYFLLFMITFLTEAFLHFSDLSLKLVVTCLKEYVLDGVGIFFAISPIIALIARSKKSYWLALVITEVYNVAGLFAGMSSTLQVLYPITAVFNLSGYNITTIEKRSISSIILLLCGILSVIILKGLNRRKVTIFNTDEIY